MSPNLQGSADPKGAGEAVADARDSLVPTFFQHERGCSERGKGGALLHDLLPEVSGFGDPFSLKPDKTIIRQNRSSLLLVLMIMVVTDLGAMMDRLRQLRTFISVAEHASFTEAARRLNMSPTTVTRTIAALEASLGVPLLMRTTRSVRLTEDGAAFLKRCRAGLAEIDQAFEAVRGAGPTPRGTLTVTAPVMFGRLYVLPIITEMLTLYPDLQVRLLLLDRVVRLVDEGVDIAVRIADLPDSSLHMLRIGQVRRVLSASPHYLKEQGEPATLADLRHHDLITIEDEAGPNQGCGLEESGRSGRSPRLLVNNMDAAISAAVAGLGIIRALSYQIADHEAAGRLQRVLVDEPAPALPISLLFQSGGKDRPNIRAFIDVARRRFSGTIL